MRRLTPNIEMIISVPVFNFYFTSLKEEHSVLEASTSSEERSEFHAVKKLTGYNNFCPETRNKTN